MSRSLLAAALLSLSSTGAWAQETPIQAPTTEDAAPEDWTLTRVPDKNTVVATMDFTSGLALLARCQAGVYDLVVGGLPDAPANKPTRELAIQVGEDAEPDTTVWTVGSNPSVAFSRIPAIVARRLSEGGKLQVIVPADTPGGPRTRYVMDVDPSSQAIAETLTACGRPIVDAREERADQIEGNGQDGLPPAVTWRTMPRPSFPESVRGRSPRLGYVTLSCVTEDDGGLTDCVTESEQPGGYNLGLAVQRSLPRARLKLTDEAAANGRPLGGRLITFTVNFRMEG